MDSGQDNGSNDKGERMRSFPISFLAVALGLMGFTLAWQKAEAILGLPFQASMPLLMLSSAVFSIILLAYLAKLARHPVDAKKEFFHPVKMNFFPLLAKILLVMGIIFLDINMAASAFLWWAGVALQFLFMMAILPAWFRKGGFEPHHMSPAWFIPIVGCMIIPIAGVAHFPAELSWFFFSVGVFWWLVLSVIVINRMIFHPAIPEKLMPTLFILFAPPLIGYISLFKLLGEASRAGDMLYYAGLFLFLLVASQYRSLSRIRFYLSWWAYSFPLAALSIATFLMYHSGNQEFFRLLSWGIFALLNTVVAVLAAKTFFGIRQKSICVEEG
jgi:tellurite resistance protein